MPFKGISYLELFVTWMMIMFNMLFTKFLLTQILEILMVNKLL